MDDSTREQNPHGSFTSDTGDWPGGSPTPDLGPDDPAAEDAPIANREGWNPGNIGDEVPEGGDITFPEPAPSEAQI